MIKKSLLFCGLLATLFTSCENPAIFGNEETGRDGILSQAGTWLKRNVVNPLLQPIAGLFVEGVDESEDPNWALIAGKSITKIHATTV